MRRCRRRRTPWWGLVSATAAPVLLIGGWTVAAARQRGGFDPVVETISALAARGADDRWLMTTALAGLGLCHLTTAARPAQRRHPGPGGARRRRGGDGAGRGLPAAGRRRRLGRAHRGRRGRLRRARRLAAAGRRPGRRARAEPARSSVAAGAVLLGLVGWFFVELAADSARVGLSERVTAGAQAVWPMVVAWSTSGIWTSEEQSMSSTIRWGVVGHRRHRRGVRRGPQAAAGRRGRRGRVAAARPSAEAFAAEHGIGRGARVVRRAGHRPRRRRRLRLDHPPRPTTTPRCSRSRPARRCCWRSRSPWTPTEAWSLVAAAPGPRASS